MEKIKPGDMVLLVDKDGNKYKVKAAQGTVKVKGLGVVDLGKLLTIGYGELVTLAGTEVVALRPNVLDNIETIERKAQIVIPKDAAYIILHCGIRSGSVVVEGGSGSGALTIALADAVAPNGKVVSYDNRQEHTAVARRNVEAAGLEKNVEFRTGDVTEAIAERDVDAVVLDIAEPWRAVPRAAKVLRAGGSFACYVPTTNQVEKAINALREAGFKHVRAIELILREMVVTEGGIRPSFDMLGHTGYVCTGRWLGHKASAGRSE